MLFRKIVLIACFSALISGFLLGVLQSIATTDIIYSAEKYEVAEVETSAHSHSSSATHEHTNEEWAPASGTERIAYTFLSDILIAFGHSLLLTSFMALIFLKFGKPEISWRSGLIIGLGGYLSFYLATVMGLPPEVPGTVAADLQARQIWWVLTVVATIAGLTVLYLAPVKIKLGGLLLVAMPHIFGAPQLEIHGYANESLTAITALSQLEHQFLISTAWVNLVYWLVLGAFSGLFADKLLKSKKQSLVTESSYL